MPKCSELTCRAKKIQTMNRNGDSRQLWDFVRTWISKFDSTDETNVAEKLIYLWVTVNAWASKSVPDLTKNHIDAYLVHCMAKDRELSQRFDHLYKTDINIKTNIDEFIGLAPVFQSLWLNNKGIQMWDAAESRSDFVAMVFENKPFITNKNDKGETRIYSAFAPLCALDHITNGEPIPADWPHLLSMIYQVRCNLFHGGKNYNREADRKFIELAYKILWDVWKDELPADVFPSKLPWERILVRSGFIANPEGGCISLVDETDQNVGYLKKIVNYGSFGAVENKTFTPEAKHIEERVWLRAVESCHGGAEGGTADELPIMDPLMAGLVRWLNLVGVETTSSCDGHELNHARLECRDISSARIATCILNLSGQQFQQQGRRFQLRNTSSCGSSTDGAINLLDVAEWLHTNQVQLASTAQLMKNIPLLRPSHPSIATRPNRNRR